MDVVISSFVNTHLFWVIQKKDILLRLAMHDLMKSKNCRPRTKIEEEFDQMIAVNVDNCWRRGIIEKKIDVEGQIKYICWLPDYGVMKCVGSVYCLPEGLEKCTHLAKQASLYNVVNLTTDLQLGATGFELHLKKTIEDVQGVRKSALDYIEAASSTIFTTKDKDYCNLYGDIICVFNDGVKSSLTKLLINENLLAVDPEMFKEIGSKRTKFKELYFHNSSSWQQTVDKTEEEVLPEIIFNKNKNVALEFFNRTK